MRDDNEPGFRKPVKTVGTIRVWHGRRKKNLQLSRAECCGSSASVSGKISGAFYNKGIKFISCTNGEQLIIVECEFYELRVSLRAHGIMMILACARAFTRHTFHNIFHLALLIVTLDLLYFVKHIKLTVRTVVKAGDTNVYTFTSREMCVLRYARVHFSRCGGNDRHYFAANRCATMYT